ALAKQAVRELPIPAAEARWRELRHAMKSWTRSIAYRNSVYGALLASPLGRFRDGCMDTSNDGNEVEGMIQYSPERMRRSDQILLESRFREFREKIKVLSLNAHRLRTATQSVALEIPEEPSYGKWNHYLLPVR